MFAELNFIIYAAEVVKAQGSEKSARLLKEQNHKDHIIIIKWRPDLCSDAFFLHLHQLNKLIETEFYFILPLPL